MVKSNKFDYTGRTSSGPKLGRSIAANLVKRADKKQREAVKTAAKTASEPTVYTVRTNGDHSAESDGIKGGQDASRHDIHKLDLRVPSKYLGDEGFSLLCDGLENALNSCLDLALVDFNAAGNELSTRSLARLAPIIRQSKFNLQTLDLSGNKIKVTTATQAQEWECFLSSFHDCMTLRRLDLSDNSSLGSWAFEVLARVYCREPLVDPLPATGATSTITLPDEETLNAAADADSGADGDTYTDEDDEYMPRCANGRTLADTWNLGYRRGLRSLPYLTLMNVGLDDIGALFLSYVVEQHYYPTQLISEINATDASNSTQTYRQDANLKGINYDHNVETLGKDGNHLLQSAEKFRATYVLGDTDSLTSSAYELVRASDALEQPAVKRSLNGSVRHSSLRSIQSLESGYHDKSDLNSARKKIQRNTLVQSGCRSVELWHAASEAIAYSRLIYSIAPEPRFSASIIERTNGGDGDSSEMTGSFASLDNIKNALEYLSPRKNLPAIEECGSKRSYAATLRKTSSHDSAEPEAAVVDIANMSHVQANKRDTSPSSAHRDDCVTPDDSKLQGDSWPWSHSASPSQICDRSSGGDDCKHAYVNWQINHMREIKREQGGQSDGYRDVSLRCQWPLPVCMQILSLVMEPHHLYILEPQQQRAAFAWGQKRETLRSELEWRRKDESSQILMMLVAAGCVDY